MRFQEIGLRGYGDLHGLMPLMVCYTWWFSPSSPKFHRPLARIIQVIRIVLSEKRLYMRKTRPFLLKKNMGFAMTVTAQAALQHHIALVCLRGRQLLMYHWLNQVKLHSLCWCITSIITLITNHHDVSSNNLIK